MSRAQKIKVGVLRGGPSSEYDVSLKSGSTVLKSLPEKYLGIDIFISKDGEWHRDGMVKSPEGALRHLDIVWNALHGQYGEDGKVQRILDHLGIPYTGSSSFESAVAMNKHLTKKALNNAGVKMAHHKIVTKEDVIDLGLHELFKTIPLPAVVKPTKAGSSVGVSIVRDFFGLQKAMNKAFEHGDSVIIEEYIDGREATCGVIDNFRGEKYYVLPTIEIIPHEKSDFFDYSAKYEGGSQEICPGNFDEDIKKQIQETARKVHEILGLKHYSRSDFIVHPKRGVYFLEVNTLPGLTSESLLPRSLNAVGTPLPDFFDHVIGLALAGK